MSLVEATFIWDPNRKLNDVVIDSVPFKPTLELFWFIPCPLPLKYHKGLFSLLNFDGFSVFCISYTTWSPWTTLRSFEFPRSRAANGLGRASGFQSGGSPT
ncbi:hypothetical protein AMTRI_Chr09g12750 [Amborella trichopoda]